MDSQYKGIFIVGVPALEKNNNKSFNITVLNYTWLRLEGEINTAIM